MHISEKAKQAISKEIGIPYEKIITMDDEDIIKHIENKTGKKIKWPENGISDGLPIMTIDEVNKNIDKWERDDR